MLTINDLDAIGAFVDLAMPDLEVAANLATEVGATVPNLIQIQVIADTILAIYVRDQKLAGDTPEIHNELTIWGATH